MAKSIKGIGVGEGVEVSKCFLLQDPVFNYLENSKLSKEEELSLFHKNIEKVTSKISELIELTEENISQEKAEIFKAHLEIAKDIQIQEDVKEKINEGKSQAWAINHVFEKYQNIFENMEDKYFRERASDIKDLKKRFLSNACGVELLDLLLIKEECIIVANDLSPSETAVLNKKYVKGFVCDVGGATSHSAIMARTLEIPAIVSLKNITSSIKHGDTIAIDAKNGIVEIELDESDKQRWSKRKVESEIEKKELERFKTEDCITKCGHKIVIRGNIGQPKDIGKVLENGGIGVGLFRSEFLYMENTNWPSEEEQFQAYKEVLEKGKEITIRTLDIGGDKHLDYFTFPKEMNPFLGYRALRLCLDKLDIFTTQLRALLRASEYGKLKIMFPMVATLEEFKKAKEITEKIASELAKEGKKVSNNCKIGMMVEIPSAAILASCFAKYADFFSIGSNDLIQYTHAADRMSEEVNYLYQPNSPSILKLIKMTVDGAKAYNRETSVCGEMASNYISAILIIGLGIDSLSMSASAIPNIKRVLSQVTMEECRELANKALNMENEKEVVEMVEKFYKEKLR